MQIRESTSGDTAGIVAMYPRAFPDEDLVQVVTALLDDPPIRTSLVATIDREIVGNVIFTTCVVNGSDASLALLAPLAVAPDHQRRGIGSALVREGLARLAKDGIAVVLVLGDPAYYSRFGFEPECGIDTPLPIPTEWRDAWQSLSLIEDGEIHGGPLVVPEPWNQPALWAP